MLTTASFALIDNNGAVLLIDRKTAMTLLYGLTV